MEASESFDCRICLQPLSKKEALKPCNCSGSQAYVHRDCLKEWIVIRGYNRCNVCKSEYTGIELKKTPKSFIAWIQEEPEGLGLILVGFLVFGFLFYVLLIGYSQFFTSQGIVANVWRIILIVLVSFFTLLTRDAFRDKSDADAECDAEYDTEK
ncbi:E3 ubiquitin-protein ligase MARCH3-like protein [Dinothrombium tinctorium]|uniref:E3 ubiquitin-protein ligase MARCH3-like protein n=1 Tax=Dinothrombium tinctorium TaxID=1965070 RepID=A0A3S4RFA7_9ACAR|nr:E3 ubiquitin-protein ligase MARCH3-like protein [Dinothrombium tinctorium]RWS15499.1 E3 ubiquitin-protein ligase MARCH3-like protein [Dinothrombium tinctorium]RWS15511.1 E3 ubiquitin-protein ligase MARCH3-like protein [Dinothrombium tinctorium]